MDIPDADYRRNRSQPLDARQLATFHAVATELSFTRAAARLAYAQSSVTAQVQALERDLGTALFERLGRTVTLTDGGRRLLPYAERLLALSAEARAAATGSADVSGSLTIGAPDSLCAYRLPGVISDFRREFPRVQVTFRATRSCPDARRAVAEGLVDAALMLDDHIDERRMTVELLQPEPLAVLVAADHPLATVAAADLAVLSGQPAILTETGCGYRDLLERRLLAAGVDIGNVVEFASLEAIKECVKAGMGFTVLPVVAVRRELEENELVGLPWTGPPLVVRTQLVRHRDKWMSPALTAFLEHVRRDRDPSEVAGRTG